MNPIPSSKTALGRMGNAVGDDGCRVCFSIFLRVQLNEAQDEIMKKKELLEDLQPDTAQTSECRPVIFPEDNFP